MANPLVWALALAVLVVTSFLVPLLLQLRRTALAVERLATSATDDLRQVSGDVHAVRLRVDAVATSLQVTTDRLASFSSAIGSVGSITQALIEMIFPSRNTKGGRWRGIIAFATSLVSAFLLRREGGKAKRDEPRAPPDAETEAASEAPDTGAACHV